ncbi:hypothetical protein QVD17_35134 [Tagetes erecta]|uniref:E3 ubiquitin-protein ligase RMA n=1 Tax=Tagetes erecta TaxID=13708 RepID=A0AAD8JZC2_TARER|nr:hypothetical protein QVD17_35134 [Tagetes erecta]
MGDNLFPNLDLNQDPFVDPSPLGFNEHQPPQRTIEDRFRLLSAACFNSRQSHRNQRVINNPMISFMPIVSVMNKHHKRDKTHLAKALKLDLDEDGVVGDLFDCNVCLNVAKDPILTCCGHLFCWGCFYQVPYVDSFSKECPVCKGEVIDANITPVYGNGNASESSLRRIPPRPQAHRVESVVQQSFSQGVDHSSVRVLNFRNNI